MPSEYYTPAEIAEKLNVSASAVYRWISDGKLRAARFGKSRRVSHAALEEFIRRAEEGEIENSKLTKQED